MSKWKQRQFLHNTSALTGWAKEIPMSGMYPPNMTVDWLDTDKPEHAQFERDITYTFNEHGYRGDSFYDEPDIRIVACGCSMTVGVGVKQEETWPARLQAKIQEFTGKTASNWNLATSGASTDYVARTLYKVDRDMEPDLVYVYWPPITRLELPTPYGDNKVIQAAIDNEHFPKVMIDESYLTFNFNKNYSFVESLYNNHAATFFSNPVIETLTNFQMHDNNPFVIDSFARDGMHPDHHWHERVAEYFFNLSKSRIERMMRKREILAQNKADGID